MQFGQNDDFVHGSGARVYLELLHALHEARYGLRTTTSSTRVGNPPGVRQEVIQLLVRPRGVDRERAARRLEELLQLGRCRDLLQISDEITETALLLFRHPFRWPHSGNAEESRGPR